MTPWMIRMQPIWAHPMVADGRAWVVAVSVDLGKPVPMFLLAQCVWCVAFSWTTRRASSSGVACTPRDVDRPILFRETLPPLVAMGFGALFLQSLGFLAFSLVCVAGAALYYLDAQRRWVAHQERALRRALRLPVRFLARAPMAVREIVQEASPLMPVPPLHLQGGVVSLHASMACRRWITQRHWAASLGWSGHTRTFWAFPTSDQILRHFSLAHALPQCTVRRSLTHTRRVDYDRFKPLLVSMGWRGDEQ
jgi:hypothetical protein